PVAGRITLHNGVCSTHGQDRVPAVADLFIEERSFELTEGRGHTGKALAELDELLRDHLLSEPGLQKPRFQMPEIPAIERNGTDIEGQKQVVKVFCDIVIADRPA